MQHGSSGYRFRYIFYIWANLDNTSLCIDYFVESCKITVIHFGSMLPYLKDLDFDFYFNSTPMYLDDLMNIANPYF